MGIMAKYNNLSFRYKLAIAFAVIIAFSTSINLYYSRQVKLMTDVITKNQQEYYQLNELSSSLSVIKQQLDIYLDQKQPAAFTLYFSERTKVEDTIEQLVAKQNVTLPESYNLRAIENAAGNFIRECNLMFWQVNANQPDSYMTYYRTQSISSYLSGYLDNHLNLLLAQNAMEQSEIARRTEMSNMLNLAMLTASALFCLVVTVNFSGYITRPISALAESAERITDGDYQIPDLPVIYDDEVGRLTRSFNLMKKSVEASIEHLNQRAELEAQLHQKELENLKMSQLLHESQYLALQSQINPHFLFNTLNVIARTAVRGTPKTTTTLIYSLADLFRYNLDHINNFSTLNDELEIVGKYIYIQKHRFGERIQYRFSAGGCERVRLPSMLLQPLVENAIIHGIEDLENGGMIVVDARRRGEKMLLRVYDNGSGMTKERLKEICEGRARHTGHTTGIGLSNIMKRIQMIEGAGMRIKSGNHGTMISMILPFEEKENADEI